MMLTDNTFAAKMMKLNKTEKKTVVPNRKDRRAAARKAKKGQA